MDAAKVTFLREKYRNLIDPSLTPELTKRLEASSDESFEPLLSVSFKNPTTTLLLSIFLRGLSGGRFYVGDIKGGIIKIVVIFIVSLFCAPISLIPNLWFFSLISMAVSFIWWVADIAHAKSSTLAVNGQMLFSKLALFAVRT